METEEILERLVALHDERVLEVAERALTIEEVARRFRGARRADVAKHLETLEVLGVVSRLEGERYQVQAVGQGVAVAA